MGWLRGLNRLDRWAERRGLILLLLGVAWLALGATAFFGIHDTTWRVIGACDMAIGVVYLARKWRPKSQG